MNLSIIIPSASRIHTTSGIDFLVDMVDPKEGEIILVEDGGVQMKYKYESFPWVRYATTPFAGRWGNPQRNVGMEMAKGTHLMFMDDDDMPLPDYLKIVKEKVQDDDRLHLFKISHSVMGVIWTVPKILHCNVSSQMIVVPNRKDLPQWTDGYTSDLTFLQDCVPLFKDKIVWHEDIILRQNGARGENDW